jgi:ribosomal protein S2
MCISFCRLLITYLLPIHIQFKNALVLTSYLFSFGAHIGHLKCEAYHGLCSYVLGTRHSFAVFDINKTIPMIKNALLFFEQLVYNFGQALFCYSSVSALNTHVRTLFVNMTKDRNQSFSY